MQPSSPGSVFVIAEAGVNHNGSADLALELVLAAAAAGADAVKFQTFRATELVTPSASKAPYQIARTGSGQSQLEMIGALELSPALHHTLKTRAESLGLEFMSTAFDLQSLRMLVDDVGVLRLKVPSGELTNLPLLLAIGACELPVLVSTGMADLREIAGALRALAAGARGGRAWIEGGHHFTSVVRSSELVDRWRAATETGWDEIAPRATLLHCTTQYPTPLVHVNMRAMTTMRDEFGLPVGYSDHTLGGVAALTAVAMGATVIEKHLTLDRSLPGPDHAASLEPDEFAAMVDRIREVSTVLGSAEKGPSPDELVNRSVARRSLVAGRAIRAGEPYTLDNVVLKRPADGIDPMRLFEITQHVAAIDLEPNELIPDS